MTGRIRHGRKRILAVIGFILILSLLFLFCKKDADKKNPVQAYEAFLENRQYEDDFDFPSEVRYEFAYIDEDEIPELLLADGNFHISRVAVYYYDTVEEEVKFLASFSSFGQLHYIPRKNTIISSYGNHGYYFQVYSEIQEGSVYLKDVILSDGSKMEQKYYYGFEVPEDFTGGYGKAREAVDTVNILEGIVGEEHRITEEQYEEFRNQFPDERKTVIYSEMNQVGV